MAGKTLAMIVLAIFCCLCWAAVLAAPDEERYVQKELNRDLYDWINNVARYGRVASSATLCKYPYFSGNMLTPDGPMPKRNSELINSLLSLPKNMNEAGK